MSQQLAQYFGLVMRVLEVIREFRKGSSLGEVSVRVIRGKEGFLEKKRKREEDKNEPDVVSVVQFVLVCSEEETESTRQCIIALSSKENLENVSFVMTKGEVLLNDIPAHDESIHNDLLNILHGKDSGFVLNICFCCQQAQFDSWGVGYISYLLKGCCDTINVEEGIWQSPTLTVSSVTPLIKKTQVKGNMVVRTSPKYTSNLAEKECGTNKIRFFVCTLFNGCPIPQQNRRAFFERIETRERYCQLKCDGKEEDVQMEKDYSKYSVEQQHFVLLWPQQSDNYGLKCSSTSPACFDYFMEFSNVTSTDDTITDIFLFIDIVSTKTLEKAKITFSMMHYLTKQLFTTAKQNLSNCFLSKKEHRDLLMRSCYIPLLSKSIDQIIHHSQNDKFKQDCLKLLNVSAYDQVQSKLTSLLLSKQKP